MRLKRTLQRAFASCALAALTATAAFAEDTKLTVWSDPARASVFETYSKAENGVTLDVVTVAPDELVTKLQLAMRAGSEVPDVIWMSTIDVAAQLSTRRANFLMDLTGKVDEAKLAEFSTNANAPCNQDGKLLCLRNDVAQYVTWVNKPLLEELGKSVPATWEEFGQLGAELGPEGYILGSGVTPFLLLGIMASSGCDIAIPQEDGSVAIDLTSEPCVKSAKLIDEMRANGSLSQFGAFEPDFIKQAVDGKLPLMVAPTWFGEFVIRKRYEVPQGALTAAVPPKWENQDKPLTWSGGGGTFGVYKDTENPDAAVEMITWATTDTELQSNAPTTPAHLPSAEKWLERVSSEGYYADDGVVNAITEAATYTHPGYKPLRFNVVEAIGKVVVPGLGQGKTVEEQLPALEAELKNLAQLNRYEVK